MKNEKIDKNSREIESVDKEDLEDLDRFIEKRKIQNEALKKIAGMKIDSMEKRQKKRKDK